MFGAAIRAATTFAGGMLFAAVLSTALNPFIKILRNALPAGHILLQTFTEVNNQFVILVLFSVALAFIARAVVESQLPGGI